MWSLRSRSSQGHSNFKVKVILKSNINVFQFLSRSRWLAFVRMLILLVYQGFLSPTIVHVDIPLVVMKLIVSGMVGYVLSSKYE